MSLIIDSRYFIIIILHVQIGLQRTTEGVSAEKHKSLLFIEGRLFYIGTDTRLVEIAFDVLPIPSLSQEGINIF